MPVSLPHNLPIAPRLSGLSVDTATCFSSALPGTCSGRPSTETHRAPLSNQSHPRGSHCSPLVQVHLQDRSGQEDPRGQEDLCLQMLQERPACRAHPGGTETRTMSAHGKHPCPGPTDPSGRGQTRDSPEGAEGGRSFGRQGPAWMEGGTPHTHRWARQAWESSLTTLPRQTDDASLTRQTLGTWWTIGTLREERQEMRTDRVAQPLPPSQHSSVQPRSLASPRPLLPPTPCSVSSEATHDPAPRDLGMGLVRDLQRDHHLQALLSRQGVQQDLGGQGHQLGQGGRCLLEHLWDHLFQKDQGDQGVQGCPRRRKCGK